MNELAPWESPIRPDDPNDKRLDLEWINNPRFGYRYDIGWSALKGVIPFHVLSDLPDETRDAITRQELHGVLEALDTLDHKRTRLRQWVLDRHSDYVRKNAPHMLSLFR